MPKDEELIEVEDTDSLEEVVEFRFTGQGPNEDVLVVMQRHPMVLFKAGLIVSVGLILVVASFAIFGASSYSSLIATIYIILALIYGFASWHVWQKSHYIVTNNRVISMLQKSLFHRVISEVPIKLIKNVSYETSGLFQTILDYGAVKVLTSGKDEPDVSFLDISHPYGVQQRITEVMMSMPTNNDEVESIQGNVLR